jgi:hypothetical protein
MSHGAQDVQQVGSQNGRYALEHSVISSVTVVAGLSPVPGKR